MTSAEHNLDNAICYMLGLPKGDQLLLPLWGANMLAAEGSRWIVSEIKLVLLARGDGMVSDPEKKAA
jgi:hypothetical protein